MKEGGRIAYIVPSEFLNSELLSSDKFYTYSVSVVDFEYDPKLVQRNIAEIRSYERQKPSSVRKKKKSLLGYFGKKYDVLYQSTDQQRVLFDKADSIEAEVKLITDIQANDVFALCNAGMLDVDDTVEETFISCMMRSRTTLKGGESYMEYFKREVAKVLCHYNHSAWIIHVKDVLN
jgi:hypothetical protein